MLTPLILYWENILLAPILQEYEKDKITPTANIPVLLMEITVKVPHELFQCLCIDSNPWGCLFYILSKFWVANNFRNVLVHILVLHELNLIGGIKSISFELHKL